MPKKGEKITDPEKLAKLTEMRAKATEVRQAKALAKNDMKLANELQHKKEVEEARQKIKNIVSPKPEKTVIKPEKTVIKPKEEPEEEPEEEPDEEPDPEPEPKQKTTKKKPTKKKKKIVIVESETDESSDEEPEIVVKKRRNPIQRKPKNVSVDNNMYDKLFLRF